YEHDPINLRKLVPWSTDLDADEPIAPPTTFTSIAVRASVECPTCRAHVHLSRLESELGCVRCGASFEVDPRTLFT
ncbi:hypothetical protein C1X99_30715, partial [Pseudomonas sp. FW306-02-H06B]